MKRCSPWPAPFSPQAPPKIALLCSPGSSILWRGPTPPERARLPWGFAPSQTGLAPFGPRRSRGLPVLVHVVSQRARGLRLRRTDCSLAIIANHRGAFLHQERVGILILRFSKLNTRPTETPVYASSDISRCLPQD